jgi:hypothetical protein
MNYNFRLPVRYYDLFWKAEIIFSYTRQVCNFGEEQICTPVQKKNGGTI